MPTSARTRDAHTADSHTADSHTDMPALMRGVAGGLLLGTPLVYTQEVWQHGGTMRPALILALFGLGFLINVALARYVGVESGRTYRPLEDAVVGTGVSIVLSVSLLTLLRRIDLGMSMETITGIIALTSIPVGIGSSVGNALAPSGGGTGSEKMTGTSGELLAAAAGTVLVAMNIAPTEEPILMAGELTVWHLAAVVAVSLVLSYAIVFYAEFGGKEQRRASDGATQGPLTETVLAYLVALVLCSFMLAAFGRLDGVNGVALSSVIVLALPGALGGALGRMLV